MRDIAKQATDATAGVSQACQEKLSHIRTGNNQL